MTEWMNTIFGDTMSPTMSYSLLFAAVILGVVLLLWIARKLLGGTFVSGGRSRHLRLAVMDATPVDSRRRLVLVRRDDVEHLILIGGPTDLVVEQNIRLDGPPKAKPAATPAMVRESEPARPAQPTKAPEIQRMPEPVRPAPMAAPVARQPAPSPQPVMQPRPAIQPAPTVTPQPPRTDPAWPPRAQTPVPPAPAPVQPAPTPSFAPVVVAAAAVKMPEPSQAPEPDIDDALLADLSESLSYDEDGAPEISLEKEMESLLGSLDTKKDRIS